MRRNVLIIGAAGDICIETIKKLDQNHEVNIRVGARNPERAKTLNLPDVEIMNFDYCNPSTFEEVFVGIDNWMLVSPPAHLQLHDCVKNVIDHAIKAGVKHVVNVSSFGIYDDDNPMRIIECHLENAGVDYTFLRPNCYMQYFNTYFRQMIIDNDVLNLPSKESKTSFVDMRDVAEAAAVMLTKDHQENKTFQLTGPQAIKISEVAELLSSALGREIRYVKISEEDFRLHLKFEGWTDSSIQASIDLCKLVEKGWNSVITNGILDILGREPGTFKQYALDYKEQWNETILQA